MKKSKPKYCQNCDKSLLEDSPYNFCSKYCKYEHDYKKKSARRQAIFEKQNGLCGFCKEPLLTWDVKKVHIDHDHETGYVRSLVHSQCNFDIGFFERVRKNIPELTQYVDFYRENPGNLKY